MAESHPTSACGALISRVLISGVMLANAAVAQSIQVPAGQHVVLTVIGHGVQIYRCEQSGNATVWAYVAPEAQLYANGQAVGSHGEGPTWTYNDGSSVAGRVVATVPSSNATAIPLVLLKASSSSGNGLLTSVTYIQRTATEGGAAPKQGCGSAPVGTTLRVPYAATYTFYAAAR